MPRESVPVRLPREWTDAREVSLNPDDAYDPIEPAPRVWHDLHAPCPCGRWTLDDPVYTFFPTAVFVRGTCPECGRRSAIFAPYFDPQTEDMKVRVDRELKALMHGLAQTYGVKAAEIIDSFLDFITKAEILAFPGSGAKDDQ